MDKTNPLRVLQVSFACAFLSLAAFGFVAGASFAVIAVMSVICGICISGSQTGMFTVTTVSYPSDIRGTGTGWAYAFARIGGMGAPATVVRVIFTDTVKRTDRCRDREREEDGVGKKGHSSPFGQQAVNGLTSIT
jgi:sugar phosphate permease